MSASGAAKVSDPPSVEPSMEEILASIRRIIADDNLGTKKDEAAPPAAEIALPPPPEAVEDPDADVLDLAEVATVTAQAQEVEIPADHAADPLPAPLMMEDAMMEREEPLAAAEPLLAPMPMPIPAPASAPAPHPVSVPATPMASVSALESRILSDNTGSVVSQAFQSLSRHTPMPAMGRSLEDVVVEMLRPMLRGWLDENLPAIVEKLVKAEIERVARGG